MTTDTQDTDGLPLGNCPLAGDITAIDVDGDKTTFQLALLIQFDSPEALCAAIKRGAVEFTFLGG